MVIRHDSLPILGRLSDHRDRLDPGRGLRGRDVLADRRSRFHDDALVECPGADRPPRAALAGSMAIASRARPSHRSARGPSIPVVRGSSRPSAKPPGSIGPRSTPSYRVLAEYGNMSSPTVAFILDRLRHSQAARPCVALGVRPGASPSRRQSSSRDGLTRSDPSTRNPHRKGGGSPRVTQALVFRSMGSRSATTGE